MSGDLVAGTGSADITPEAALPLAGYGGREGLADGVHDRLGARALALSDGDQTMGIVSVDLLNVSEAVLESVRTRLRERGIVFSALTVAATHTHAAPYVPTPALEVHPTLPRTYDASTYVETVATACVKGLSDASRDMTPATIRTGTADNAGALENRRTDPGWGARIPRGEIDPQLTALSIRQVDGSEVVVYNYPLHPVCTTPGENRISGDWPAYTADVIRERRESVESVLFLNGACGDINPRDKTSVTRRDEAVYAYMSEIGASVGDSVLAALDDADAADPITSGPITIRSRDVRLDVKDPGDPSTIRDQVSRIKDRLAAVDRDLSSAGLRLLERERTYLREQLAIAEWDAPQLVAQLDYVGIGPVGVLTVPAEVLVNHGLRWKAAAAVDHLLPATYANDYIGYVPELRDLENGGYEVETCKIDPESIRRLREAGRELVSTRSD